MQSYLEFVNTRTRSTGWWSIRETTGCFDENAHYKIGQDVQRLINSMSYFRIGSPVYQFRYLSGAGTYALVRLEQSAEQVDERLNMTCTVRIPLPEQNRSRESEGRTLQYCMAYLADFLAQEGSVQEQPLLIPQDAAEVMERQQLTPEWVSSFMECLYKRESNTAYLLYQEEENLQQAIDLLSLGYFLLPQAKSRNYSAAFRMSQENAAGHLFTVAAEYSSYSCGTVNTPLSYDCGKTYLKNMFVQFTALCSKNSWDYKYTAQFENRFIGNQRTEGIYLNFRIFLKQAQADLPLCTSWKEYRESEELLTSIEKNPKACGLKFAMLSDIPMASLSREEQLELLKKLFASMPEIRESTPEHCETVCRRMEEAGASEQECRNLLELVSGNQKLYKTLTDTCITRGILSVETIIEEDPEDAEAYLKRIRANAEVLKKSSYAMQETIDRTGRYCLQAALNYDSDLCYRLMQACDDLRGGSGKQLLDICMRDALEKLAEKQDIRSFSRFSLAFQDEAENYDYKKLFAACFLRIAEAKPDNASAGKIAEYRKLAVLFPEAAQTICTRLAAHFRSLVITPANAPAAELLLKELLSWIREYKRKGKRIPNEAMLELLYRSSVKQKIREEMKRKDPVEMMEDLVPGENQDLRNGLVLELLKEKLEQDPDPDPELCRIAAEQLKRLPEIFRNPAAAKAAGELLVTILSVIPREETVIRLDVLSLADLLDREAIINAFWESFDIREAISVINQLTNDYRPAEREKLEELLRRRPSENCAEIYRLFWLFYQLEREDSDTEADEVADWLEHRFTERVRMRFLFTLLDTVDLDGNRRQVRRHLQVVSHFMEKEEILEKAEKAYKSREPEKYRVIRGALSPVRLPDIDAAALKNRFFKRRDLQ